MDQAGKNHEASEREADLFEVRFHRGLASKQSKTGWGVVLVGGYFLSWGLRSEQSGAYSLVLPLIMLGISLAFHTRASGHRRRAGKVEARLRAAERTYAWQSARDPLPAAQINDSSSPPTNAVAPRVSRRGEERAARAIDSAPDRAEQLFHRLLAKCMGDRAKAERLIDFEKRRAPGTDRAERILAAIDRWERDLR